MLTLPSREVLAGLVQRLKDKRVTEATLNAYANDLFEASTNYSREDANTALQFLLLAPMSGVDDHLGEDSPGISELVMIRHALDKLAAALDEGRVELDTVKVRILREVLSQKEQPKRPGASPSASSASTPSIQRPSFPSGISAKPPLEPSPGPGRRTHDPLSRAASLDALAMNPRAFEAPPVDPLDSGDEKRNEVFPYLFASITLAITAFLILQMTELRWPLWLRVTVCATVPVAIMGFWAATRKYKFLKWVRFAVIWGAATLLLIVVGRYAFYLYRQMAIQRDFQAARERIDVVSDAVIRYQRREGDFPPNLEVLSEDEEGLKLRFTDHKKYFVDPFAPDRGLLQYNRYVDGFILSSVGPQGTPTNLTWPNVRDEHWRQALADATYDPTNGLESTGSILFVSKAPGDK